MISSLEARRIRISWWLRPVSLHSLKSRTWTILLHVELMRLMDVGTRCTANTVTRASKQSRDWKCKDGEFSERLYTVENEEFLTRRGTASVAQKMDDARANIELETRFKQTSYASA